MKKVLLFVMLAAAGNPVAAAAGHRERLTLLFLFPAPCKACSAVMPVIGDLSGEFSLQGVTFGPGNTGPVSFTTRRGSSEDAATYGYKGEPMLVALSNGTVRQSFSGESDIKDAPRVLSAFRTGALSVSEAVAQGLRRGERLSVSGWLKSQGEYFKGVRFFLTDRKTFLPVRPWLPLETVKSPFHRKRPRLMSDLINKPVVLEGVLSVSGGTVEFSVKKEITNE